MKQQDELIIPKFSLKSSLFIIIILFLTNFVLPAMISLAGFDHRPTIVIANMIFGSLAVCISRFYIDTKRGFMKKKFIKTYILFALSFGLISYFWVYLGNYI